MCNCGKPECSACGAKWTVVGMNETGIKVTPKKDGAYDYAWAKAFAEKAMSDQFLKWLAYDAPIPVPTFSEWLSYVKNTSVFSSNTYYLTALALSKPIKAWSEQELTKKAAKMQEEFAQKAAAFGGSVWPDPPKVANWVKAHLAESEPSQYTTIAEQQSAMPNYASIDAKATAAMGVQAAPAKPLGTESVAVKKGQQVVVIAGEDGAVLVPPGSQHTVF